MIKNQFWQSKWMLALSASVLLALSFPPFDLSILQIPALFFMIRAALLSDSKKEALLYTYPGFVLWNLFSTYWLMMATVAGGVAAILANALIMVLPLLLIRSFFRSGLHPVAAALFSAAAWVTYEFLHHRWDLAWPWLTLGNAWSNHTVMIQYISWTGVLGISFWVMGSAALFYAWLSESSRKVLGAFLSFFLFFPVLSLVNLALYEPPKGEPVEVVVVQPDSDSYQTFGGHASLDKLIDKLITLSDSARTESTDVILWPENAVDTFLTRHSPLLSVLRDSMRAWDTRLITGSGFAEFYDQGTPLPQVTRQSSAGRPYNMYNSALLIDESGLESVYKKGRLVPIVERFPFLDFFHRIDIFGLVDWPQIGGYGKGYEATLFDSGPSYTSPLICYDSVFPGWVNEFVDEGAQFLAIVTNDGWWGNSHGHVQHFAYARLRAIEQRMWVARSANNGISGIISPDGGVRVQTEYQTEDAFSYTIYTNPERTLYNRMGDWPGYLSILLLIAGVVLVRRESR
ncbi:MAG TPA: apolipoprotein N-acyltransferase [Balneolaceae bacterium]|nr:apolipoprotein N-acyltransferase [Balneolaceae bacterium]